MAQLIETAEQHVALHLGTLTAQNFALACALERRDRLLAEAQARIGELEAALAASKPAAVDPRESEAPPPRSADGQADGAAVPAGRAP
ncbi:hypothetical protein ACN9MF_12810 [Methylobacterium fujisawaense]|uniref:hypothetical protein n=1 Tax=Methylobacterium fujisawaense TaxID=107400 RepID=UPI003CF89862